MRRLVLGIAVLLSGSIGASAQHGGYGGGQRQYGTYGTGSNSNSVYVQPRINSGGGYTQGHHRTAPNNTQLDNYGTRGNLNPYTGAIGSRRPGW